MMTVLEPDKSFLSLIFWG